MQGADGAALDFKRAVNDNETMLARVGHCLLIIALIGATGTHWTMLQSVAWARMLAENVRTSSLEEAINKTFDGKHPCALCKQIAKSQKSEQKPDVQVEFRQLEFPPQSAEFLFSSPAEFWLAGDFCVGGALLTQAPLVPPPRFLPV